MKAFIFGASLLVATAAHATPAGRPQFELAANPAGGRLSWHGHTYKQLDGDSFRPNQDDIVEHPEDGSLSVCLQWSTEPDAVSGEFLAAFGPWRIPRQILAAPRYVLGAERASETEIVFTLTEPEGRTIRTSPPFRLARSWIGNAKDLAKHGTRISTTIVGDGAAKPAIPPGISATEPTAGPGGRPAEWARPVGNTTLGNCFLVSAELFRSEQPHAADLPALRALGIKSLLNLRQHHADDQLFERAGLMLLEEGMRASDVSVEELVSALRRFRAAPKPVLVHCWRGSDRTGFFVAGYRIICQGWSREAAIDELRHGGFGYHASWYPNIVQRLAALDVEMVKRRVFAPEERSPEKPARAGAN